MVVKAEDGADPQTPLCTSLSTLLHWEDLCDFLWMLSTHWWASETTEGTKYSCSRRQWALTDEQHLEVSQHYSESPVKHWTLKIHFTVKTETKAILSYSALHKIHPFFLTLHTGTLLMHPSPACSGRKRHFNLHGDHKNMAHFYGTWY